MLQRLFGPLCYFEQNANFSIKFNHEKVKSNINICASYISMFQLSSVN